MNDEKIWLETEDGQKLFIIKSEKIDMQEELNKTIDYLQQELQRKDNMINELKDELKEARKELQPGELIIGQGLIDNILDKIKELENEKNNI